MSVTLGTKVSSNNKMDCHDITEILLKVVLNTINLSLHRHKMYEYFIFCVFIFCLILFHFFYSICVSSFNLGIQHLRYSAANQTLTKEGSFWLVIHREGSFWLVIHWERSFWLVIHWEGSFWLVMHRARDKKGILLMFRISYG